MEESIVSMISAIRLRADELEEKAVLTAKPDPVLEAEYRRQLRNEMRESLYAECMAAALREVAAEIEEILYYH